MNDYILAKIQSISCLEDELSGITYSSQTKTLFIVTDDPPKIYSIDKSGRCLREIYLKGFHDTEGIVHLDGNRFVIVEEDEHRICTEWRRTMIRKIKTILSNVITAEIREDEAPDNVDQSTSVEQKIKAIMANVFKIDINEINEETSADDIAQWTSLEHVEFVLNLQKEFDIEFTDSQIVEELLSYKTVVQTVTVAVKGKNNFR